jgi:hypothetical protein
MNRRVALVESIAALLGIVVAVLLYRGGTRVDSYGPLLPGSPGFVSTYYSGPWIGGAVAVLGLSALLVIDAVRRILTRRAV